MFGLNLKNQTLFMNVDAPTIEARVASALAEKPVGSLVDVSIVLPSGLENRDEVKKQIRKIILDYMTVHKYTLSTKTQACIILSYVAPTKAPKRVKYDFPLVSIRGPTLYITGNYLKLVRGLPQSPFRFAEGSVEEEIVRVLKQELKPLQWKEEKVS